MLKVLQGATPERMDTQFAQTDSKRNGSLFQRSQYSDFSRGLPERSPNAIDETSLISTRWRSQATPPHGADGFGASVAELDSPVSSSEEQHVNIAIAKKSGRVPKKTGKVQDGTDEYANHTATTQQDVGHIEQNHSTPLQVGMKDAELAQTQASAIQSQSPSAKAKDPLSLEQSNNAISADRVENQSEQSIQASNAVAPGKVSPPQTQAVLVPHLPQADSLAWLAQSPASKAEAPTIHVTIGRVEIRAVSAPQTQKRSAPPKPTLSLSDYLGSRHGGRG